MLGINNIASFLPERVLDNVLQAERFDADPEFVTKKIGVSSLPRFNDEDSVVKACVEATKKLQEKSDINLDEIECIVLCTQNPDGGGLPHNSALIHAELELPESCACFDIGLGCSGYVYGLSVIQSFMSANGMRKGLFFTCDPYSRILDSEDKNTCLLFGDAASVTLISDDPLYVLKKARFATKGVGASALKKNDEKKLVMNGRAIFNFALQDVPLQIKTLINECDLTADDIDLYLLHQGSRFMLENAIKRSGLPLEKSPIALSETGNTVSTSIPLLFESRIHENNDLVLMSGFGVGLSWASAIYEKVK